MGERELTTADTDHAVSHPPLTPVLSCVMFSICFDVTSVCLIYIQSLVVMSFLVPYKLDWRAVWWCPRSLEATEICAPKSSQHTTDRLSSQPSFGIFVKSISSQRNQHGLLQGSGKTNAHERPETLWLPWASLSPPSLRKRTQYVSALPSCLNFITHPRQSFVITQPMFFLSSMISILLCQ